MFLSPVPPSEVLLQSGEIRVRNEGILTVTEGKVETITCVTRNSNPAPLITWMLGKEMFAMFLHDIKVLYYDDVSR